MQKSQGGCPLVGGGGGSGAEVNLLLFYVVKEVSFCSHDLGRAGIVPSKQRKNPLGGGGGGELK